MISAGCSYDFKAAFWGYNGWRIGAFSIITASFFALFIANVNFNEHFLYGISLVSTSVILLMAILHAGDIDVFNLHEGINHLQYYNYLSTIGNVNWLVGYLSLFIPLFLYRYLIIDDNRSYLYLAVLFLFFIVILLANSDGLYLALGFVAFFIVPFICSDFKYFRKCINLFALYALAILFIRFPNFRYFRYELEGINKFFASNIGLLIILVIYLVVAVIIYKVKNKQKILNTVKFVVLFLLFSIAIYFAWQMYNAYRTYNTYWGNNRLLIWQESLKIYGDYFNVKQKVMGVGPEMLSEWYYYLSQSLNARFLVSHSEIIQVLMTLGLVSLSLYLLMVFNIIKPYFAKGYFKSPQLPFLLSLIAYLAQSMVNSMSPVNVALVALFMGMYLKKPKNS